MHAYYVSQCVPQICVEVDGCVVQKNKKIHSPGTQRYLSTQEARGKSILWLSKSSGLVSLPPNHWRGLILHLDYALLSSSVQQKKDVSRGDRCIHCSAGD